MTVVEKDATAANNITITEGNKNTTLHWFKTFLRIGAITEVL